MAEQIGGQIFIDTWGLVCPGDPEKAARYARKAASVSHDGNGIYGGMFVAGIEAAAFVDKDATSLLDIGLSLIPPDSTLCPGRARCGQVEPDLHQLARLL